jgi:hypothetical protein
MDLRQIVCEGVDWIHLAHDAAQWLAVAYTIIHFRVQYNIRNLLVSWATVSFWKLLCFLDIVTCISGCMKQSTGLYTRPHSSVSIVCTQRTGWPRNLVSIPTVKERSFPSAQRPDGLWGPPSLVYNGYSCVDIKLTHSPPSSAQVKHVWSYTSTQPYVFM